MRAIRSDLTMDYTAVGQTTHLAARMEQIARPGAILVTADTLKLAEGYVDVTPLGPVPVKGIAEPVEIFELVGAGAVRTRLQAARARVEAVASGDAPVYGINTGFGMLAQTRIPTAQRTLLQKNIILSHSAGVGPLLDDSIVRLVMVLKLASLLHHASRDVGMRRQGKQSMRYQNYRRPEKLAI